MAGNNSLAAKIRKMHLVLDQVMASLPRISPQHKPEAALQAHLLASKSVALSRKLRAEEILAGHYVIETPKKKPAKKRKGRR